MLCGMEYRKVIEGLKTREKSDRERISLYLSRGLYDQFRALCSRDEVSPAKVMEEFMRQALQEGKKK